LDHEDVENLVEPYRQTLANGKLLAEFIIKENRRELLSVPASEAFKKLKKLQINTSKQISSESKLLTNKFKI